MKTVQCSVLYPPRYAKGGGQNFFARSAREIVLPPSKTWRRPGQNRRELNYAHARKSLPVASPKDLFFCLVNLICVPNLTKIGREMGALS